MAEKERSIVQKSIDFIKRGKFDSDSDDDQGSDQLNYKHTPVNHKVNLEMINY